MVLGTPAQLHTFVKEVLPAIAGASASAPADPSSFQLRLTDVSEPLVCNALANALMPPIIVFWRPNSPFPLPSSLPERFNCAHIETVCTCNT